MGDVTFHVVPADMDADAAKWGSAAESLSQAHTAVPALDVSFGGFQSVVGAKYSASDLAVRNVIELGASRLQATSTNVTNNNGRTKGNDGEADKRVTQAGAGNGGSGSGNGTSATNGTGGSDGGKGEGHYAQLMGIKEMPADPKDPDITFDRHVDEQTGEVSWTPREMKPGEGEAIDGRDVERIPQRADRIVVTMVDGEPQITYVDTDARAVTGSSHQTGVQPQPTAFESAGSRVVAGSGATEPGPQLASAPAQTEWSRPLPEGADYAVVEVRGGEPHLVFLDVEGTEVTQVSDHALTDRPTPIAKGSVR